MVSVGCIGTCTSAREIANRRTNHCTRGKFPCAHPHSSRGKSPEGRWTSFLVSAKESAAQSARSSFVRLGALFLGLCSHPQACDIRHLPKALSPPRAPAPLSAKRSIIHLAIGIWPN